MLRTLKIENFRCFQSFELQQLGRLNLLVGTNNSGKTSILEAVQLLSSKLNLESLRKLMAGRGEYILNDERSDSRELDVCHLFYGHEINVDSRFSIIGGSESNEEGISVFIEHSPRQLSLFEDLEGLEEFESIRELALVFKWLGEENKDVKLRLSAQQGLSSDYIRRIDLSRRIQRDLKDSGVRTQFVTSSSLTTENMIDLYDQVVLTAEEKLVTEALQTIEPNIERIAPISSEKRRYTNSRSGFIVKFYNNDQRIPIGSMGDGIWRILGLTLAIINARNGILLVDEIDTGLHFSTMSDMWKLVWETAKRLNVQVFATTHSRDCWESLATIANAETPSEEGITIHRIEKGKTSSVVFNERQVVIAAEQEIEVR